MARDVYCQRGFARSVAHDRLAASGDGGRTAGDGWNGTVIFSPMHSGVRLLKLSFACAALGSVSSFGAFTPVLVTDQTNYNVGTQVLVRFDRVTEGSAAVRYAGDPNPVISGVRISGSAYRPLWAIPVSARTGRYLVDVTTSSGEVIAGIGTFAVHRQMAKIVGFELDKTFYTAGDAVDPRITVQNISNQRLEHLQVEFEAFTYPWIAPAADEPPVWKTIADSSLSLAPGEAKEFRLMHAAVVQAETDEKYVCFSAVIRDAQQH